MALVTNNPVQALQDVTRKGSLADDSSYGGIKLPEGAAATAAVVGLAATVITEEVRREAERQRKEQEEMEKRSREILAQLRQGSAAQTTAGLEALRSALNNGELDKNPQIKQEAQRIVERAEELNLISSSNSTKKKDQDKERDDGRASRSSSSSSTGGVGERVLTSVVDNAASLVRTISRNTTPT